MKGYSKLKKKKLICIFAAMVIMTTNLGAAAHTTRQQKLHSIAQLAREIGLEESNPIIAEASRLWWEEESNRNSNISVDDATVVMLAKTVWCEARGMESVTQQAAIIWCVLNRVDSGKYGDSIESVLTAPYQFAYRSWAPTVDDYGRDLVTLAQDVISRWEREKNGEADVGRILPSEYIWYTGNGRQNFFRNQYAGGYKVWDWSWPSPYES